MPSTDNVRCPHCNHENHWRRVVCVNCGRDVRDVFSTSPPQRAIEPSSRPDPDDEARRVDAAIARAFKEVPAPTPPVPAANEQSSTAQATKSNQTYIAAMWVFTLIAILLSAATALSQIELARGAREAAPFYGYISPERASLYNMEFNSTSRGAWVMMALSVFSPVVVGLNILASIVDIAAIFMAIGLACSSHKDDRSHGWFKIDLEVVGLLACIGFLVWVQSPNGWHVMSR